MDKYRRFGIEDVICHNDTEEKGEPAKDILDVLLDKDNRDPIVLVDEKERRIAFEQVAIIPFGEGVNCRLYVILKPMFQIDGINDDEAIVFCVSENDRGDIALKVEMNEKVAIEVFNEYYKLLDKAHSPNCVNKEIDGLITQLSKKSKGDKK